MASSQKTSHLQLNHWLGSDKPKREDFNLDNQLIDSAIKTHVQDTGAHVTDAERETWNSGAFTLGSYVGDGAASRAIALGYRPRVLLLFTADRPLCEYNAAVNTNNVYSAAITPLGVSKGIAATDNGFTVETNATAVTGSSTCALNQNGKTYLYLVYR